MRLSGCWRFTLLGPRRCSTQRRSLTTDGAHKKAPWQLDVYTEDEKDIMDDWVRWLRDYQNWRVGRWRRVRIGTPVQYRAHIPQENKTDGFLVHIRHGNRYDLYFYEEPRSSRLRVSAIGDGGAASSRSWHCSTITAKPTPPRNCF